MSLRYELVDDVQFRDYRDCGVLIDMETKEFFELNATATLIIRSIKQQPDSAGGIWQRPWTDGKRDLLQNEESIAEFLAQLLELGLICPVETHD